MKKLNTNNGATMLMALLFMLVAVVVSVVTVTAAISATQTISKDREQQQAYLTVSSAAQFLREEIVGQSYVIEETKYYEDSSYKIESSRTDIAVINSFDGSLSEVLDDCVKKALNGIEYETEFVISVEGMDPVDVILRINTDYTMVIDLCIKDATDIDCIMNMKVELSDRMYEESFSTGTINQDGKNYYLKFTTRSVTYKSATIQRGPSNVE